MQQVKAPKIRVEWEKGYSARVFLEDSTGNPSDEFVLLDQDLIRLDRKKEREKFVTEACRHIRDETEGMGELLRNQLIQEFEERSKYLKKNPATVPARNTKPYKPLPDQALDTDIANASRLVHYYGRWMRYCDPWKRWLLCDGRYWAEDQENQIFRAAMDTARAIYREIKNLPPELQNSLRNHARASQNRNRLEAMVTLARSMVSILPRQLDADRFLFAVQNGVLNMRSGEWLAHDPGMYITKMSPVIYDPKKNCPGFMAFLNRVIPDPQLQDYIQRLFGMCLTGDITYQALPVFYGAGANGKSTLIDLMLYILGDYAGTAADSLFTARTSDEHPTELADLQGRRLVVGTETDEGRKMRIALVKRLTGDTTIKARKMRCDYYEFTRTHKSILVTNNRPRVPEDSEAIWRRIKLVPFNVVIPPGERDPNLLMKLKGEASGVLNWMMTGCIKWQQQGMVEPEVMKIATDEYRQDEDPLKDFIDAQLIQSPDAYITARDLYAAYVGWATAAGIKFPLGDRSFGERIGQKFGKSAVKKINGESVRVYSGIGPRMISNPVY